ncbi:hypothetical protein SAY86_004289 [Trapa natans]|uniref:ZF-HD dimerization-type domain-containing protein n=1 Tax=Trapa natans TaxID=22666 RepID=A0AAN7MUZ7_TRANT|nr:hypothetical protein SAY86_004289 [Trapa natans]
MDIPIPTQEVDIPIPVPLSSAIVYGGGSGGGGGGGQSHVLHRHHHHNDTTSHISPTGTAIDGPFEDHQHHVVVGYGSRNSSSKAVVRYRECMKNHAAAMGGTAMDGCGEFMPSGEEGTIEALTCSACSCHRNFHRKEIEGGIGHDYPIDPWYHHHHHHSPPHLNRVGRKVILGHPTNHKNLLASHEATLLYPTGTLIASTAATPHKMIMPYSMAGPVVPSESDEQEEEDNLNLHGGGGGGGALVAARPTQMVKKRFRTKFTQEQKEKMLSFAEKVGWKIQRQEESVVQQFCQEVGVKRRVLKVWMHNNKHSLARKNDNNNNNNNLNIIIRSPVANSLNIATSNTNTNINQSLN